MAVTRFEGESPVARYWLANCKGFAVKGGAHGVVEQLIHDADSLVPTRLVVRTRSRRKQIVSAGAVESVVPANRVLVVERRRERRHVAPPRSVAAVRVAGARASRVMVPTAQAAGKKVALAGPPARSALVAARGRTVVLAREAWRIAAPRARETWHVAAPRVRLAFAAAVREARPRVRAALLVLASSLRILASEVRATVRMLGSGAAALRQPDRRRAR